ncbi:MAG: class I mannose-6-phosphate isomerase [Lachnospiraceae bacterium]|nr:class I mannose-6-phosphate isomerase [Lachnospiraceae bacterium]
MSKFSSYNNYDSSPITAIEGYDDKVFAGSEELAGEILNAIKLKDRAVVALDIYPGVDKSKVLALAKKIAPSEIIDTEITNKEIIDIESAAKPEAVRMEECRDFITDDRVFGVICHKKIEDFYDEDKVNKIRSEIAKKKGIIVLVGFGTELFAKSDIHVFFDISRWEIQLRYRKGMPNWNCTNTDAPVLTKYKIGYFIEWRLADRYKKIHFDDFDYVVDGNSEDFKAVTGEAFRAGLKEISTRPFRMEPYFDPGVWGGKWMQNMLNVGKNEKNLAWCFDGVPEENAINLKFGDVVLQFPTTDVTLYCPRQLLGERVHGRYGAEFPIRFDFLDTIGGGNLSLQVHPLTEYIQDKFGMHYTQDESYYILDVDRDKQNYVYLGLKTGIDKEEMAADLRRAEKGEISFPAEKYVNKIPVNKHDHVWIPAGTVHCSGEGCMVLEISATPYIFTFKLWDWDRVGLDGLPRPIHVEHGLNNIQWDRDTEYVNRELIHKEQTLLDEEGCKIERTGLHYREPIEVERYSIERPVSIKCDDSVIQGNLVDGREAIIRSEDESFPSLTVHYAESFIIPASVGEFVIEPTDGAAKVLLASIRR